MHRLGLIHLKCAVKFIPAKMVFNLLEEFIILIGMLKVFTIIAFVTEIAKTNLMGTNIFCM